MAEKGIRKQDTNLMTEGSYAKKLILFALPVMLGDLFQQLYNAIDSLIVGNFIGSSALAAVSSAGNLLFLIVGFFQGIAVGASVVVAQFIGARNARDTSRAVHTTVAFGLASSAIMTVLGLVFAPVALKLINTPADVLPESVTYFRVYFAGVTGLVMYNTFVCIIRASGDSRHPLYYLVASSLMNVVLDYVFIAVLGYGVGAAALATSISQVFSAVLAFTHLVRSKEDHRVEIRKIRFDRAMLSRIIRYGLPSGVQWSIISLSNLAIQSYINSYGKMAMAGIGAYTKIEGFSFLPVNSFGAALTTFIGQNMGAGKTERTRRGIRFGVTCTVLLTEAIGVLLFVFAPQMIAMFDSTPETIAFGTARARICSVFYFLVAFSHVMAAVFKGFGKATVPMLVMMICWCGVRIAVLAITQPFFHAIELTYWIYPVTWLLSSIAFTLFYRRLDIDHLTL